MANRIQLRRDTTANWESVNPILADGEPGYDIVTNEIRIGDGSTAWTGLSGNTISGSGGVPTDIYNSVGSATVGSSGQIWQFSGSDGVLTLPRNSYLETSDANLKIGSQGNVIIRSNAGTLGGTHTWNFNKDGGLTVPGSINGVDTSFTGAIAGNVLTVTDAVDGTIARGQTVYSSGVAAGTVITIQLTQTSANAGGNGTYRVTGTQTVTARTMTINSLYLDGDVKLAADHGVYVRDAHDPYQYDNLIGVSEVDATIFIGSINTNGVTIENSQEYKVDSALNPGTYMAVAKVDSNDNVILASGNSNTTQIRAGGITGPSAYGLKIKNGGEVHVPYGMNIGSNQGNQAFGASLEINSDAAVDGTGGYAGISLVSYRNSDQNGPFGSFAYGARYRGTTNVPLATAQDDTLMEFGALGWDGANLNGGGELMWSVDGAVTAGVSNPSRAEIFVTRAGTVNQTLGLKIDSNLAVTTYGNLIVGGNLLLSAGGQIQSPAGTGNVTIEANDGNNVRTWAFETNGNITFPDATTQGTAYQRVTGSWTVATGSATYSFTVPQNGTYTMWVRGNIPNGIIVWNATATVTNTNVPVIGQQFAWNYNGAGTPLEITAIPTQFVGTAGTILASNPSVGTSTNTFTFTINNISGSAQTVYWGYVAQ
jgi:hypothetical protein